MEELRKEILTLQKQMKESDSLKERRNILNKIEELTESLMDILVSSSIKVTVYYEVILDFCELPNNYSIVEDYIENGDLMDAIRERTLELKIDPNDLIIEIQ